MPYFDNFGASNKPNTPDKIDTPSYVFLGKVIRVYTDYFVSDKTVFPPGSIECEQVSTGFTSVIRAYPFDELSNTAPLINELVDIYTLAPNFFYRRKNYSSTINNSLRQDVEETGGLADVLPSTNKTDYKTGNSSATSQQSIFEKTNFKPEYLNRLKYYEGDSLYQSRFGQSIRFSGYNNSSGNAHPTIIIRNRQADKTNTRSGYKAIEEDINYDGSTIAISSGDYVSDFLPGKLQPEPANQTTGVFGKKKKDNKKGKSNFYIQPWTQEKQWAFGPNTYPKELSGDQIILTSDRVILSSRVNEMMFFSKGNMGIFADSDFSIDTKNNIKIVTHNKGNIFIESSGGQIWLDPGAVNDIRKKGVHLGHPEKNGDLPEGVIKGQILTEVLAKLVKELLEGMKNGKVYTPAGPTGGIDPIWEKTIADLVKQINTNSISKSVFAY